MWRGQRTVKLVTIKAGTGGQIPLGLVLPGTIVPEPVGPETNNVYTMKSGAHRGGWVDINFLRDLTGVGARPSGAGHVEKLKPI